jgi:flagellar motor switch protein FliM
MSSIRPGKYNGTTAPEIITNHLYKTNLPVVVEFGSAKLTMKDLLDMEVGDIIELENKITDEHSVKVSNKNLFYGRAGIVNNHKAIKITRKFLHDDNS